MISVKIVMVIVLTLCLLSNMKTVSTAVEELRDTVNEKIGEEKTAREEVVVVMTMVMLILMIMLI